jgi:Mor family transcriptional regulator
MVETIKVALLVLLKRMVVACVSEQVLRKVVISLLEEGAKRTDWELDDQIVEEIKKAL